MSQGIKFTYWCQKELKHKTDYIPTSKDEVLTADGMICDMMEDVEKLINENNKEESTSVLLN